MLSSDRISWCWNGVKNWLFLASRWEALRVILWSFSSGVGFKHEGLVCVRDFPWPWLEFREYTVSTSSLSPIEQLKCEQESYLVDQSNQSAKDPNQVNAYLKGQENPCPTFLLTIKLPGIKAYKLCSLLDSGVDYNLASPNYFPLNCWIPTNTTINSVTHFGSQINHKAIIPLQFSQSMCPTKFLQFSVEMYDCIIGSQTLK